MVTAQIGSVTVRDFLDILILVLADLRLTRLVTTDDLGYWLLREPLERWADFYPDEGEEPSGLKSKIVSGLACPFCVGFWVGLSLLATLFLAGGPGHCSLVWEYAAGAFALNYLAGHIAARLDGRAE